MNDASKKSSQSSIGEVDLERIVLRIWEKRKQLAIISSVFFILGIIYAFFIATPMYMSTTTLYPVGQEKGSSGQLQVLAAQFGFSGLTSSNNYNIPDIVRSRRIRKKIIDRKWATNKFPGKKVYLYDFWNLEGDSLRIRQDLAIEKLGELITVSKDDDTELITINVMSEEPRLSADIVNYISGEISDYVKKIRQDYGRKNRVFIEKRLSKTKAELTDAEEALKRFREENRIVDRTPDLQLEYARLQRNITIKQEVFLTLERQKEMALIEETKDTPIINILDIGEKPIKKAKPKRIVLILVFTLIGIIVGIMAIFSHIPLRTFRKLKTMSTN